MLTTVILVAATLASAVVGTLYNPSKWVKALIIGFASVTAGATVVTSYSDEQQKQFTKAALGTLIVISPPTPAFNHALDKSIERVANKHDLLNSRVVTKDSGVIYEFYKRGARPDDTSAVFAMDSEDRAVAFLAYISGLKLSGQKLDATVEPAMFTSPPQYVRDEQTQAFLDHEALIGNIVLEDKLPWISFDTPITIDQSIRPLSVKVTATSQGHDASVEFASQLH